MKSSDNPWPTFHYTHQYNKELPVIFKHGSVNVNFYFQSLNISNNMSTKDKLNKMAIEQANGLSKEEMIKKYGDLYTHNSIYIDVIAYSLKNKQSAKRKLFEDRTEQEERYVYYI